MIQVANSKILLRALNELNAIGVGDTPQQDILDLAVQVENEIIDDWNAERGKIYADQFLPFTIIPNQNPTTIGPGADWDTGGNPAANPSTAINRPVSIDGIQVLLTGTPVPYVFCTPRDKVWWQRQPSPETTASFPTDFYYNPSWEQGGDPWGSVYLWPVPTTAYDVQLLIRGVLEQVGVNTTVSLPPGYNYALVMTLAERLATALRKPWTPAQGELAKQARMRIESNNVSVPRIGTKGFSNPNQGGGLPSFFFPTGSIVGPR